MKLPSPMLAPEQRPLKPPSPLQPPMQASMKPPSPMLAPEQRPLKPPSPLQPKNAPKTPISRPQRRWRFQLGLSLREQRRCRFHTRDFRCRWEVAGPGRASSRHITAQHRRRRRCGGRRRVRRARAGFEIDHSEPQARVWRSRGRPGPTAPGTPAEPQATSSIANSGCAAGVEGVGGTGGRKRAWLRRPRAVAGPGCGARGRWRGLTELRADAPSHTSATRRHWCEGAGGSGGHGRASRSTTPREARVWRSHGRPGPTAPGTPARHKHHRTEKPQNSS